jgi:hypothetical protein
MQRTATRDTGDSATGGRAGAPAALGSEDCKVSGNRGSGIKRRGQPQRDVTGLVIWYPDPGLLIPDPAVKANP